MGGLNKGLTWIILEPVEKASNIKKLNVNYVQFFLENWIFKLDQLVLKKSKIVQTFAFN